MTPEQRRAKRLERRQARKARTRKRILRSTAVLPGLFTISNGLFGFAAIHLATRHPIGSSEQGMVGIAAWLLLAAMACDMLDGRLARFTRRTSDFGGQLDSLCDVISFGVAPPILMLRTVMGVVHGQIERIGVLAALGEVGMERILWCVAGVYVACAAMRLARFNVENDPDESAHMDFRGLPSPGAAAAVASLVLLYDHLRGANAGGWLFGATIQQWLSAPWVSASVCITLPVVTLATAMLMVSRFRYAHVVNQYMRGKRPFNYLVKLVVAVLMMLLEPFVAIAGVAMVYVLSGPTSALWRRARGQSAGEPSAVGAAVEPPAPGDDGTPPSP